MSVFMKRPRRKLLRVPYAATVYGKEEIAAVLRVLANPRRIVAGRAVHAFEARIAKLFGKRFGVMVNSGSSANLIGLEVLDLPRGSEVITPVLTFSTTLSPIIKLGLQPALVDVELGTYLANLDDIEKSITPQTRAIMIPSLMGNVPDFERLARLAKKHGLYLVEDACDTLGSAFGARPTGVYSDVSTTSFYASHIITAAGGGGMVCFNDPRKARRALLMANWGRESTLYGAHEHSEKIGKRFSTTVAGEVYDGKFIFSEVGYNFQCTELEAAFGLVQLKGLQKVAAKRRKNFDDLRAFFTRYDDWFILPVEHEKAKVNWLAFPLTLKQGAPFSRHELALFLESRDIQTRPILAGNVLRQPGFAALGRHVKRGFPIADQIMRNGLMVGCHHGLEARHVAYLKATFAEFLSRYT
jgi:CDP-6-deoxy-D-xylo-4-hexulose-3-dehydrase